MLLLLRHMLASRLDSDHSLALRQSYCRGLPTPHLLLRLLIQLRRVPACCMPPCAGVLPSGTAGHDNVWRLATSAAAAADALAGPTTAGPPLALSGLARFRSFGCLHQAGLLQAVKALEWRKCTSPA